MEKVKSLFIEKWKEELKNAENKYEKISEKIQKEEMNENEKLKSKSKKFIQKWNIN